MPEGGLRKSCESTDIADYVRIEPALMRAKRRFGHTATFSIKSKGQVTHFSRDRHQESAESPAPPSGSRSSVPTVLCRSKQNWTSPQDCACEHRPRQSLAAALPAFGHAGLGSNASAPNNPTTCEPQRLARSLHYPQPGTQNEFTDQKTQTGPDRSSDRKNIPIPRISDSVAPAHTLFGCVGTDAGSHYHYHYRAVIDLGRSDPDCKRH